MDNKEKTCCFFGHREVIHTIRDKLTAIIERLITEDGVTEFYVGNQGQFDSMVYSVLKELKAKYPNIRYTVVLAYMPDEHIQEVYGECTKEICYQQEKRLDDTAVLFCGLLCA